MVQSCMLCSLAELVAGLGKECMDWLPAFGVNASLTLKNTKLVCLKILKKQVTLDPLYNWQKGEYHL